MLRIVNLEEITNILLCVPSLINLQENKDTNFIPEAKRWLLELEKILERNKIPAAGTVASLRSVLISSERGAIPVNIEFQSRATGRKIREATAAYVIRQANDIVSNLIRKDQERISEAERITRQLISMTKVKGLIREHPHQENFAERLRAIWRMMSADQSLSQGTQSVEGLIGPNDALIILDRSITQDIEHNLIRPNHPHIHDKVQET